MDEKINILVVEDEFITLKIIREALAELGYTISGDAMDAGEAISVLEKKQTDIAILDIQIQGEKDGIWLAHHIKKNYNIPFIFLTANSDKNTIKLAAETQPNGYLVKPFTKEDIYAAIEIALKNFSSGNANSGDNKKTGTAAEDERAETFSINDSIFIKENKLYKKIRYSDILYVKSEGHYLEIYTTTKKHVVRESLKIFSDTNVKYGLMQIHRSYLINLNEIESFGNDSIIINKTDIPLAPSFKEGFLKAIKII